jgi:hypothetical protein
MFPRLYDAPTPSADSWIASELSASLGSLLRSSARARAQIGPMLGLPGAGPVRVARNELLFRDDACLGRVDLRVDCRDHSGVFTALVAVRYAERVDPSQLWAYRRAMRGNGVVAAISTSERDASLAVDAGARHVGWQALARALVEVGDDPSEELLSLLAEAGLGACGPMAAARGC